MFQAGLGWHRTGLRWCTSLDLQHFLTCMSLMLVAVFAGVSFSSLAMLDDQKASTVALPFAYLDDVPPKSSLFDIIDILEAQTEEHVLRTHLNEEPYWLHARLLQHAMGQQTLLSFTSRHWVNSSCWLRAGDGDLHELTLQSDHNRRLMVDLAVWGEAQSVLCRFQFVGPASLQIDLQSRMAYEANSALLERRQGYLEGVLYLMIGLVSVAALMTRNFLFLCHGFWLFASLRVVAMQEGWDHTWMGLTLSPESLAHARMLALAMYYTATILVVTQLFENLRRPSWRGVLLGLQASCFAVLVLSLFLPYRNFLELFWPLSLMAIGVVAWVVVQYFIEKKDLVAVYYLSAMGCMLMGVVAEVLAAWFDLHSMRQYFNSATATVLASLMSVVALAEFLRKAQAQRQLAAEQIRQAHERLKSVFNIAPSAMFTCNRHGRLLHFNQQFEQGYLDSKGLPSLQFLMPQHLKAVYNHLQVSQDASREEIPVPLEAGQTRWYELVLIRDAKSLVGMVSDCTQRKDRELALQHQATHDELTGALNRRGLQACIHRRLQGQVGTFTLFCVDVRQFGRVISAHGLKVADDLLKALCIGITRSMSRYAEVARLHVDHFVVLVNDAQREQAEQAFAGFVEQSKLQSFEVLNRCLQVELLTCKVYLGVVDNVLDVMETVEASMRETKVKMRNLAATETVVFDTPDTRRLLEHSRIVRRLGDHQLPPGLTLAWQPILRLNEADGPIYAEALLRQRGSDGSLKGAGALIEACVAGGHTAFLDNWVLTESLEFLTRHARQLKGLQALSVNMSPASLNNDSFLQDTLALIRMYAPVASKLCLEITEVGSVINLVAVQKFIEQVRLLGVRIALDDFGAGYSNFRYAIDLRADVIKIDGSIVRGICQSTESHAVTIAIAGLAHNLGCKCVAEWVEDLHTLREIKDLGVDYAQGYVIAPALDPTQYFDANSVLELIPNAEQVSKVRAVVQVASARA